MMQASELTVNIQVKTIIHHDENSDIDIFCKTLFDEIQATSSMPAENWQLIGYKTERISESEKKEVYS